MKSNVQQREIFPMSQIIFDPENFFPKSYLIRHTLKLFMPSDIVLVLSFLHF